MQQLDDLATSRHRRSRTGLQGAARRGGSARSEARARVVRVPGGFAFVENRAAERR